MPISQAQIEAEQTMLDGYTERFVPMEPLLSSIRAEVSNPETLNQLRATLLQHIEEAESLPMTEEERLLHTQFTGAMRASIDEPESEESIQEEAEGYRYRFFLEFARWMMENARREGGVCQLDEDLCPTLHPNMWRWVKREMPFDNDAEWKSFVDAFLVNIKAALPLQLPRGYSLERRATGFVAVQANPENA